MLPCPSPHLWPQPRPRLGLLVLCVLSSLRVGAGATTDDRVVESVVAPSQVWVGVGTSIALRGSMAAGDLVTWATSCEGATPSVAATGDQVGFTTFTFAAAGTFKLCYRASGNSDSVEQVGVSVAVTEGDGTAGEACLPQAVTYGRPFEEPCQRPVQSYEACQSVARAHDEIADDLQLSATQLAEDRPYGCWWQHSAGQVYFNVPPPEAEAPPGCSSDFPCLCCQPPLPEGQVCAAGEFEAVGGACTACSEYASCAAGEVQQCNGSSIVQCNDAASASIVTDILPASISAGFPTSIALTGTVAAGDTVRWAVHCSAAGTDITLTGGTAQVDMATAGTYKLCYRQSGGSVFVEQQNIRLQVVQPTASRIIKEVFGPQRIAAGERTTLTFADAVQPGDLATWAEDCSSATPSVDLADGEFGATTFSFESEGTFKLCYRSVNGSDSVEQLGISVTVESRLTTPSDSCTLELVTAGQQYTSTCIQPVQSIEACAGLAGQHPAVSASIGDVPMQYAEDRPAGCWYQNSNGMLFFNIPPGDFNIPCSADYGCFCCNEGLPTTTTDPPPTTTTTTPLVLATCYPQAAEEGTCERPVTTADDCRTLAVYHSEFTGDAQNIVPDQEARDRPTGCWWQKNTRALYFNTIGSSQQSCSEAYPCICCGDEPPPPLCGASEFRGSAGCTSCTDDAAYALCGEDEVPQCNGTEVVVCNSLASATIIASVSPASVSRYWPTALTLSGSVAVGDKAKWVQNDCREEGIEANLTDGYNTAADWTLPSLGSHKLCYQEAGGSHFVEQLGVTLQVVAPTNPRIIERVFPSTVYAGKPVSLSLIGTVEAGARATWALDCSSAQPHVEAVPGENKLTSFDPPAEPGTYKLCYSDYGGSDSVEQLTVTLTVQAETLWSTSPCYPEVATSGRANSATCLLPVSSVAECSAAAASFFQAGGVEAIPQATEDRPAGCWFQSQTAFFNIPSEPSRAPECSGSFQCLCCGVPTTTTSSTTLTSSTSTMTSSTSTVTTKTGTSTTVTSTRTSTVTVTTKTATVTTITATVTTKTATATVTTRTATTTVTTKTATATTKTTTRTTATVTGTTITSTTSISTTTGTSTSTTLVLSEALATRDPAVILAAVNAAVDRLDRDVQRLVQNNAGMVSIGARIAALVQRAGDAVDDAVLGRMVGLMDTAVSAASASGGGISAGAGRSMVTALGHVLSSASLSGGRRLQDDDAAVSTLGQQMLALASAIGGQVSLAMQNGQVLELGDENLRIRLAKSSKADASQDGLQTGGSVSVSARAAQSVASAVESASASASSCQSLALQETAWRARNPYSWAALEPYEVAGDDPVVTVGFWHCGEAAAPTELGEDSCRVAFEESSPPPAGEVEVRPRCLRFDAEAGAWSTGGVALADEGAGSPVCLASRCDGSYAVIYEDASAPTTLESQKEVEAGSAAVAVLITLSVLVLCVCCGGLAVTHHARRTGRDVSELLSLEAAREGRDRLAGALRRLRQRPAEPAGADPENPPAVLLNSEAYWTEAKRAASPQESSFPASGEVFTKPLPRHLLVEAVFNKLSGGRALVSCSQLLPFAELVGFSGDAPRWASEYQSIAEYLGCDPAAGIDLRSFARLVDDDSVQGCFCSSGELALLLDANGTAEPSTADGFTQADSQESHLQQIGAEDIALAFCDQPLSKVAPVAPPSPCRETAATAANAAREALVAQVFGALDGSGSGLLRAPEVRRLANFVGFEGSDQTWAQEYAAVCSHLDRSPEVGLDLPAFRRLVGDTTKQGCYCSNDDLNSLLKQVADTGDVATEWQPISADQWPANPSADADGSGRLLL